LTEQYGINYCGLVELIVNAMVDMKEPFIELPEKAVEEVKLGDVLTESKQE